MTGWSTSGAGPQTGPATRNVPACRGAAIADFPVAGSSTPMPWSAAKAINPSVAPAAVRAVEALVEAPPAPVQPDRRKRSASAETSLGMRMRDLIELPQRPAGRFGNRMRNLMLLAALAMLAAACGSYSFGSSPSPSPGGGFGFDLTVTEKDHAVTMHPGQKLEVVLHAGNGMTNWSHPVSSDSSLLAPIVDPAATAVQG